MPLNAELVGKTYDTLTYEVTADAIEKYARATNDENEHYLGGSEVVASPVWPFVPAFQALMPAAMDPELQADLMRLVHGEEEHIIHRPIRPGDTLKVTPTLESIEQKGSGETFSLRTKIENQDGELVAEVLTTNFIRGSGGGGKGSSSRPPAEEVTHEAIYEESTKVDEDQTKRYAEASGDHNPIHLDPNVATMVGLPGIINHGMCTMAMAVKGAVNGLAGGDPRRVKRVKVRFTRPVLPGQEITTKFWAEGDGSGDTTTYGFETYNPDGVPVIKSGVVEVAS